MNFQLANGFGRIHLRDLWMQSFIASFNFECNKAFLLKKFICFIADIRKYTQAPLNGFHCSGDSFTFLGNISGLGQSGCVRQCILSRECTILMYNAWDAVCILGSQPCAVAEIHSQLMTQIFRQEEDLECLVSRAVSDMDSGSRLIRQGGALSLLYRGGNSYIGISNNLDYFEFDGETFWHTRDHVILVVSPWCSVAWLPYTVGEPIPLRVMVGGWWNGNPVYMLRITTSTGQYTFSMYVIGHPVVPRAITYDILIRV